MQLPYVIPNEAVMRDLIQKLESEYDLDLRLSSYKRLNPELLDFAAQKGLEGEDAAHALFVSDYIVTASEVPGGGTDEDRRQSVILSFIEGKKRSRFSNDLMRIFYFAYKTASKIRSQDLYMGGRGLSPRETALIRLKDSFLVPYLAIVSEILGEGPCGWELGILAAALKRSYPDQEIQQFKAAPNYMDQRTLIKYTWQLFKSYSQEQTVKVNSNIIIPNLKESQSILLLNATKPSLVSLWNIDPDLSSLEVELRTFSKFIDQPMEQKNVVLIKGSITKTGENIFIVRDPFIPSKPLFFLKTPADEINLSKILTILNFRGSEHEGWKSVLIEDSSLKVHEKKPSMESVEAQIKIPEVKKRGFFSRIKQVIFGKKEEDTIPVAKQTISSQKRREIKKKRVPPFIASNSFISQGITIDAVSDLDVFELFDTIRETNYFIIGIFDSDFKNNRTSFFTLPSIHYNVNLFLKALNINVTRFNAAIYSHNASTLVEEIFFMTENQQRFILSLDRNQERTVGTIATSSVDVTQWQSREKEIEPLQRRSLHMRTKQFLNARRHTAFNEAVERIYGSNFDVDTAEEKAYDNLLFSIVGES